MSAVSNTSPLRYFVEIGREEIVPSVLGNITIPDGVAGELAHPSAPIRVQRWLAAHPAWLSIASIGQNIDSELTDLLDAGESEAIQLALIIKPDFVLMDERLGRREAKRRGLNVVGALGILQQASLLGCLGDPVVALQELLASGFRVSPRLLHEFMSNLAT